MKKIFTLAAVALCTMNLSAQEMRKAADFDLTGATLETLTKNIYAGGTKDAPDTSKPGELKTSQIVAKTANVTLTRSLYPQCRQDNRSRCRRMAA